ncbi:DUF2149 domain-containing protein [Methylobacillus flagellatus]|uniref:DUF2149 domain-containing protein n=1 Tax=Methylobacillus flagellatus (strain ATCC 51484 / DSM 6875 / VKM B-1610 / KT) TaxID=265072 RepID=Q1GXI0_METFK|nr:DUF2149 domain-containing protein [Methylobacillus flagellatus]ABE48387.1 conserved hypothetical protein [Methylobacillus flagellatus KT]
MSKANISKLRLRSRFDHDDEDPRASLVNLVDVMLVFACGLLAALSAGGQAMLVQPKEIEQGKEIEAPETTGSNVGSGYQAVGQVYRDPKTGKLVLIENPTIQP